MEHGAGVELQPDSLFTLTTDQHVPGLAEMMKVKSVSEFENLKAPTSGTKRKLHCYAVLNPSLAEAVQGTDMKPTRMFLALTDQMRVLAPSGSSTGTTTTTAIPPIAPTVPVGQPPVTGPVGTTTRGAVAAASSSGSATTTSAGVPVATVTAAESDEDKLLKKMAGPYAQVLRFVWAAHHLVQEVTAPTVGILQDSVTMAWERETRSLVEPSLTATQVNVATPRTVSNNVSQSGALTAMTELSEAMTRYQEASAKVQDLKADIRQKAWTRLPQVQKNILLLGGVKEDGTYNKDVTEEMISILGCSNGAQVDQYLKQVMVGHNVKLEPGLCSALNKGILIHADDTTSPKHFTPFLTPPISDDKEVAEKNNLLKLAVQTNYSENDVSLLTKMDVSIPMKTQELKHQMKNIAGLSARCLGSDSLIYQSLKDVADHIEKCEISYNYGFCQDKMFGGNFLDRIHWRMNRFFDLCAMGDPDQINLDKLDFSDILQQMERREYNCKAPSWLKKFIRLREKTAQGNTEGGPGGGAGGGEYGGRNKRRSFDQNQRQPEQENRRNQRVINLNLSEKFKLV